MAYASPKWRESHDGALPRLATALQQLAVDSTWADLAGLSFNELDRTKAGERQLTPRPQMIGNPYLRQQKPLIDFSLIKPKKSARQIGAPGATAP